MQAMKGNMISATHQKQQQKQVLGIICLLFCIFLQTSKKKKKGGGRGQEGQGEKVGAYTYGQT